MHSGTKKDLGYLKGLTFIDEILFKELVFGQKERYLIKEIVV